MDIGAVTTIFSVLTVIIQIISVIVIISLFSKRFSNLFSKKALLFSFILALFATLGSLFYSEIAKYDPCKLCWLQRIMMYPQTIILGIALIIKDKKALYYSGTLSLIGIFISLYQYLGQITSSPSFSCSLVEGSVSCSTKLVFHLGYITIPMMALSVFLLNFLLFLSYKKRTS